MSSTSSHTKPDNAASIPAERRPVAATATTTITSTNAAFRVVTTSRSGTSNPHTASGASTATTRTSEDPRPLRSMVPAGTTSSPRAGRVAPALTRVRRILTPSLADADGERAPGQPLHPRAVAEPLQQPDRLVVVVLDL